MDQVDDLVSFMTVASKGGPHDDDSYEAGWWAGHLDAFFEFCHDHRPPTEHVVLRANLPQLDQVAVRHGMVMTELAADRISPALLALIVRELGHEGDEHLFTTVRFSQGPA